MDCSLEHDTALSQDGGEAQDAGRCRLLSLPDEILQGLLSQLHIHDLLAVMKTCKRFYALGLSRTVQGSVTFGGSWPNPENERFYTRALNCRNKEAIIKLGVAALYGEGIKAEVDKACFLLKEAERLVGLEAPFTWLLFRPPWSSPSCSKARIYTMMSKEVIPFMDGSKTLPSDVREVQLIGHMAFCVAKTLTLMETPCKAQSRTYYEFALHCHCGQAALELQRFDSSTCSNVPHTSELGLPFGNEAVDLQVCLEFAQEGYPLETHKAFVRRTVARNRARARGVRGLPKGGHDEDGKMRFILMDWLVEVADLKSYSRETMYIAVSLVDRYLARFTIAKKMLQLLGIACMVVAARYCEAEVITIREAAWLTDNTYTYEQIVRTVGQALCAVDGRVWTATSLDFLKLYLAFVKAPAGVEEYACFVAEMSLLRTPLTVLAPSVLAAAVVYIAMHVAGTPEPWPKRATNWTGLCVADFAEVARKTFELLSDREPVKDHRGVELKAAKDHYERTVLGKALPNLLLQPLPGDVFYRELQRRVVMETASERILNAPTPSHDFSKGSCVPLRLITNATSPVVAAARPKPLAAGSCPEDAQAAS